MQLRFTSKERRLITSLLDQPHLSKQLESARLLKGFFEVRCSEEDFESLLDSIAAESNHCESQRRQDAFDELFERLSDDPDWHRATGPATSLDRQAVSKLIRSFLEQIRPDSEEVRKKLDYGFSFHGRSVELLEIRPKWRKPGKTEHAFAKATYIKAQKRWRVYWMRGNLKWHPYEPPTVASLEDFLKLVAKDEQNCFFG